MKVARRASRGQVIVLVAIAIAVLLGAAALAVDVGYYRWQQRLEQTAADSAAIAGANELLFPARNYAARAAADATANGFTNGVDGASVVINNPPASGRNAGNGNAVEVIITKQQPNFFAKMFGGTYSVAARAVAILSSSGGACIYVLNGGLDGDLSVSGGGRGGITTTPLCGIIVNGDVDITGNANVDAAFISYAGTNLKKNGGDYPHGQPVQSVEGLDPCSTLPGGGCKYLSTLPTTHPELFTATCLDTPPAKKNNPGTLPPNPLPPGRYCYGPYSTTVTLQSGLFIMDGGIFQGPTTGSGVTIYNNCTVSGGNNCDVTLNGNSTYTITAPTTGNYAGMVYYQPPSLVNTITVNGASGTVNLTGGLYAPNGALTLNGQLSTISFLVAGNISANGGGLNAGFGGGYPVPQNAVLTE